jgi:hypothetical protein
VLGVLCWDGFRKVAGTGWVVMGICTGLCWYVLEVEEPHAWLSWLSQLEGCAAGSHCQLSVLITHTVIQKGSHGFEVHQLLGRIVVSIVQLAERRCSTHDSIRASLPTAQPSVDTG